MNGLDSAAIFDEQTVSFWLSLEGVRADARLEHYLAFARDAIHLADQGVVTRRQVGTALAPGWRTKAISESGDMTIVTHLAEQVGLGGFESTKEAADVWDQMRSILVKYW